jgi:hypothetical protein
MHSSHDESPNVAPKPLTFVVEVAVVDAIDEAGYEAVTA